MRYRWLKGGAILIVFFAVDWIASDIPYISAYKNGMINLKELVINWSNDSSGYQSLLEYGLIYMIPYILFLNATARYSTVVSMLRRNGRRDLLKEDFKSIAISAAVFCLLHESIACFMTCIFIPEDILFEIRWFRFEMVHLFSLILFYMNTGVLYRILSMFSGAVKGIGLLFGLCAAEFYVTTVMSSGWQPYCDVVLLYRLLINEITCPDVLLAIFRQAVFMFILLIAEDAVFSGKDILEFEIFT
ncbi:MAG: WxPxxD family membrane protein [Lachnospiraceae bacterium]|nr:WxPxxD family membrane protein [Lachnospiraceae bacterium]